MVDSGIIPGDNDSQIKNVLTKILDKKDNDDRPGSSLGSPIQSLLLAPQVRPKNCLHDAEKRETFHISFKFTPCCKNPVPGLLEIVLPFDETN